jgi:hypothetical protein
MIHSVVYLNKFIKYIISCREMFTQFTENELKY